MTKASEIWVNMTDSFMSGWGKAKGVNNAYCIKCESYEQAEAILKAAQDRREMKRAAIAGRPRKAGLVTIKSAHELSGPWLSYMSADMKAALEKTRKASFC